MPIWKVKGGKWYAKWKEPIKGSRKYLKPSDVGMEQTSFSTKKEALVAEQKLKLLVLEKYAPASKKKINGTLLPLCRAWLKSYEGQVTGHDTLPKKARFCKEILAEWGDIQVSEIKVFMVQRYLDARARKFSSNSFNSYRKEGVAFFNWIIDQELVPDNTKNVFKKVKKKVHDSEEVPPAPIAEVLAVRKVANESQRDIIDSLILTAARKIELQDLKWSDVSLEERTFKLHTNKSGGRGRKTTLHTISEPFMEILQRRHEQKHPTLEFVFWHRFYSHKKKMMVEDGYQTLNRFTQRLCKKAGVPHFTLHQLRHLAASILKREGATIAQMQQFLRHDDQKTTEIYANHLDNNTKEQNELIGKVWAEAVNGSRDE